MRSHLTTRQSKFISEYAKTSNATQAAIKAGYSVKTARQQGSRLLTNVDIQQRMTALGLVGLCTLEDVASNGRNEVARTASAKVLVEMAYGKPKHNTSNEFGDITIVINKLSVKSVSL